MPHALAPHRLHGKVSVQQVGVETLIYDESRHKAFCLNESSSVIWDLADGDRTVPEIATAASNRLRTSIGEEFVRFAIAQLHQDGLMESAPDPESTPAITRRAILQRLGAGGAMLLPTVAAILAPTAAQAYSGCVDCELAPSKARRVKQSPAPRPLLIPDPGTPSQ
jgi:hypothetical protein